MKRTQGRPVPDMDRRAAEFLEEARDYFAATKADGTQGGDGKRWKTGDGDTRNVCVVEMPEMVCRVSDAVAHFIIRAGRYIDPGEDATPEEVRGATEWAENIGDALEPLDGRDAAELLNDLSHMAAIRPDSAAWGACSTVLEVMADMAQWKRLGHRGTDLGRVDWIKAEELDWIMAKFAASILKESGEAMEQARAVLEMDNDTEEGTTDED